MSNNFVHFEPQIPYSRLQNETQQNYDIAINYYTQRQENFINSFLGYKSQKVENNLKFLKNDFIARSNKVWNNVAGKELERGKGDITYAALYSGPSGKGIIKDGCLDLTEESINSLIGMSGVSEGAITWLKLISDSFKNDKSKVPIKSFLGMLGLKYEENLEPIFKSYIDPIPSLKEGIPYAIFKTLEHTGRTTSSSAVTSGSKAIRADFVFSNNITQGLSYDENTLLPWELEMNIDLSNLVDSKNFESSILSEYLRTAMSSYGISVKSFNFEKTTGTGFSESSVLYNHIENIFKAHGKESHTWQPTYASTYTMWVLSKQLISIISPITIMIIGNNSAKWISEFLSEYKFYMEVHMNTLVEYEKVRNNTELQNERVEGHPSLYNSQIMFRKLNDMSRLNNFSVKQLRNKIGVSDGVLVRSTVLNYRTKTVQDLLKGSHF